MRPRPPSILLILLLSLVVHDQGCLPRSEAGQKPNFDRWEKTIAAFEAQDAKKPPPPNAILFVGSSSIRLWNLAKSFPGLDAINRGFGGSEMADVVHFAPRILLKHRPRIVVVYAGDNDLAAGKSPARVLQDFQALVKIIEADRPDTRIIFLAVKPSPSRWQLADVQRRANRLVENYCKTDKQLVFLDVFPAMLGSDGRPRPEIYAPDRLHMNEQGYQIWARLLRPHLQ